MDLSALLDVTEPVECEFMGEKLVAHVYTAGVNRLRKEDRDQYQELLKDGNPDFVLIARLMLPVMLKGWDSDGEPLKYGGEDFPPTVENVSRCPDALLAAVAEPVIKKWNEANPTTGDLPANGLEQEESPTEENQARTISA